LAKSSLGFTDSRQGVLDAIYVMGVACCAYSHDIWVDRCDCKYGLTEGRWPTAHEKGNGCPELRSLYGVIESMTDEEWWRLVQRAGGTPRGSLFADDPGARVHRAAAAAAQAEQAIAQVRAALGEGT
jgi:hypothetical protein